MRTLCFAAAALLAVCKGSQPTSAANIHYPLYLQIVSSKDNVSGTLITSDFFYRDGLSGLEFKISGAHGTETVSVYPWPKEITPPQNAAQNVSYTRVMRPDGPDTRIEIRRGENVEVLAVSQSRLRALMLQPDAKIVIAPDKPSGAVFADRLSVSLSMQGKRVEVGKITDLEKRHENCIILLYQASVAKPARSHIAEESAPFTADWLLRCH